MGKQKQQVISRFFAPKPKPLPLPNPVLESSTPPPKISATVSFSPSKRKLLSDHLAAVSPKKPKLSPHTQNPTPDPNLHRRFLQRFLEPPPEEEESFPLASSIKYTPLEQQVVELKSKHPGVILMVEVGYRYRFFGEDAEVAARVLGIYAHMDHSFMTASVPTFRLNVHVRRLVNAGCKVGVVKQTETAAIKSHGANRTGPFFRGLSALYTKATLEAAEDISGGEEGFGGQSNFLVCVVDERVKAETRGCGLEASFDVRVGVVGVEISTGEVVHGEFNDNFMRSGLEAVVLSLSPAELLLGQPLSQQTEKFLLAHAGPTSNVRVERASLDSFCNGSAVDEIVSIYKDLSADDKENKVEVAGETFHTIMNMSHLTVQALALTLCHLKQFGFERILFQGASIRSLSSTTEMTLSANTLQQLEVVRNNSDGSEFGSLFHNMNQTLTVYGSRLLRHWVTHPLCERNLISARLDAVSEIAACMGSPSSSQVSDELDEESSERKIVPPEFYHVLSSVLTALSRSPDIQRGITRIFHRTAKSTEFIAVIEAILLAGKQLQRLGINQDCETRSMQSSATVRSSLLRKLISVVSSPVVVDNAAKLLSALNKEGAARGDLLDILITSSNQFPELAEARQAVLAVRKKLDSLIVSYRKKLANRNLQFLEVSGITHLIEVPVDAKVPMNWMKVNSTKKTIRYHPPEIVDGLDEQALATEHLAIVNRASWDSFLKRFGRYYTDFQAAVQALATLDCLHSLATLSRNKNYVCPLFVDDCEPVEINIQSGRHPVLETILQDNFVPNDTSLHAEGEYCQIITGPNMGGKSCYIRQVALISIMAQVGSFVPASFAKLHVLDGVFTRMGAADSIQHGRSTFLEELSEASHIVRTCSSRSLVIIDELGRGTSTHDGVAIAYATLQHLLVEKRCLVLFVTHYPEIAEISNSYPVSAGTYHVSYLTSQKANDGCDHDDVTYLYKLGRGLCSRSFGFKVAQLVQIPPSCIHRAIAMAANLEAEVRARERNTVTSIKHLMESPGEPKAHEEHPESRAEESTSVLSDLFADLRFALSEDNDPLKSLEYLKRAWKIAEDLVARSETSSD
ncbi:hypothetical protein N665_1032s0013 [Sinapis alba]|nr:hypothetical protein N665_1032s0013 [Sinapis alba]